MPHDALEATLPEVSARVPRVALGDWPTPIEPLDLEGRRDLYTKREDLSSAAYGGNKIRPLETVFARHLDRGAGKLWATGAFGSNQAVAIAVHAHRLGLESGAVLFPQPSAAPARENLEALIAEGTELRLLANIVTFPFAVAPHVIRPTRTDAMIPPGAATPLGAIGHLGAALEVALAVDRGELPAPRHVVLPVGSTCTTAGLLVGFAVAHRLGLGFVDRPPLVHAVRVTPWPITAPFRVLSLALATARYLVAHGGPDVGDRAALRRSLRVVAGYLGLGYGHPTRPGQDAKAVFATREGPGLDTTYSAKAGAYLLAAEARLDGPTLFWSTKSSAPMPRPTADALAAAPARARRWLRRRHWRER